MKLVSQARRAMSAAKRSAVQGLYFGELEIVAYDHRPGQSVQNNPGFGAGTAWSYWVVLQSGHPSARDIVLQENGAIDILALNGEYGRQEFGAAFQSQVGRFDIDFFEVNFHRTGVVANGGYYGMNANGNGLDKHPLHRYPALSGLPDFFTFPTYPGFSTPQAAQGQSHSALFARRDWFPAPVLVEIERDVGPAVITSSSISLNAKQRGLLESLVSQGTRRRFYDQLIVVPFGGPAVVPLDGQSSVDVNPQSSSNPSDNTGSSLTKASAEIRVSFDLSDVLDPSTDFGATPPSIVYKGDANHVPFGLAIEIRTPQ